MLTLVAVPRRARGAERGVDPFFAALGGAGTAELLIELGATDDADAARRAVRDRLVDASRRRHAARRRSPTTSSPPSSASWTDPGRNPAVALSFLLSGSRSARRSSSATTRAIVRHELASSPRRSGVRRLAVGAVLRSRRAAVEPRRPARPASRATAPTCAREAIR